MLSIAELQQLISDALVQRNFPKTPTTLYDPIHYFLHIGGKRLRPVLTLLATQLFEAPVNDSIPAALAIETFHNFTLLHDDIMDEAPLRRGRETVHQKWNVNTAILSGDALLIIAYQLLAESNPAYLPQILTTFNKMAQEVCEGQQLDMDFENSMHVSESEYVHMIRLKTSVLLGAALKIGAILGGATPSDQQLIYTFGVNMGIAFQLQDDILDVYGDPLKFGKQVGGDIIENKKTYLLINALRLAPSAVAKDIHHWMHLTVFNPEEKVDAITAIYNTLGIKEQAEATKNRFAQEAYAALDQINLPREKKQNLIQFADDLLIRES
ncbi:polyprenyl synthetase family protein [Olivibacter ginsenosidimutans]|uniref:Polyprenyl synthetase family protein n=1 Tax=Olivibacter ginsenosidimutans TaxID=1176537 RepID=A0ABP9B4K8_9SPHI